MRKRLMVRSIVCCLFFTALSQTACVSTGHLVRIGDSRSLYLECLGAGAPTVILLAGANDRGDASWNPSGPRANKTKVFTEVSKTTRACTYDRPGTILVKEDSFDISRSSPVPQPVSVNDQVADLRALISASRLLGPFVIAAHSAGGLIARTYAATYPEDVSGLVLVDVTTEDLKDRWTPEQWSIFEYSAQSVSPDLATYKDLERIDFEKSFGQMRQLPNIRSLKLPAIVLTADEKPNVQALIDSGQWPPTMTQEFADKIFAAVLDAQADLANSFTPPAMHITNTNSGHYIQHTQPQLVIDSILEMINRVRSK